MVRQLVAPAAVAESAGGDAAMAAFDASLGVTDPDDSWARAERGEDDLEPPALDEPAPADEQVTAASDPPAEPVAEEPPPKPRPQPRKRKGDAARAKSAKTAKAKATDKKAKVGSREPEEPSIEDAPAKKTVEASDEDKITRPKTTRRKKKSRVAQAE
jgi:hypothetical protein